MAKLHADHYTTCRRCHKTGISGEERQLSGHLQSPTIIDDGRLVSEWGSKQRTTTLWRDAHVKEWVWILCNHEDHTEANNKQSNMYNIELFSVTEQSVLLHNLTLC